MPDSSFGSRALAALALGHSEAAPMRLTVMSSAEPLNQLPRESRPARLAAAGRRYLFGSSTETVKRKQALRGTAWVLVGTALSQTLRASTTVILARFFIGPKEFGLIALVSVFVSGLSLLSDLGIGTDVIRHPRGGDPRFLDTAFLIQAMRGLALFGSAITLAYPFASIYHQPRVVWLVIGASFQVVVQGFTSSSIWTMTRNLENGKLTLLTVLGDLAGLLVSLTWAAISPTAWALVAGTLARPLVVMFGSFLFAKRSFRFEWDRSAAKDIFSFGAGMFLSSMTFFFANEAEKLVVAKFITVAELGCFSLALTVSALPTLAFGQVIGQVFLPVISKTTQDNPERAVVHYGKMREVLLILCAGFSVVFIVFGQSIVDLVLGPKYAAAGWMLQLLGFRGAFQLFSGSASTMLFALGYSSYAAVGNVVRLAFLIAGLAIAFSFFGFREAMWVLALSPVVAHLPVVFGIRKHLRAAFPVEVWSAGLLVGLSAIAGGFLAMSGHPWTRPHF